MSPQPAAPRTLEQSAPGGFWRLDNPIALAVALLAASLALRSLLASIFGLSFDETYNIVVSRRFDLAYFDHPPLAFWLIGGAVKLFGSEAEFVVRLPTLLLFSGATWFVYRLAATLFGPAAGLVAIAAMNLSPQFAAYFGTFATTDTPLLFGLAAAAYFLAKVLLREDARSTSVWRDWLLAGAFFGVAMLSKFSALLALPGLLTFLAIVPRQRRWLAHPAPYAAALVALAVFSPVLVWNVRHDWVAFAYQSGRAAFGWQAYPVRALRFLGVLALVVQPIIWIGLVVALIGALRRGPADEPRWLLACLAVVPVVFFPFVWLFGQTGVSGYQWAAPGYLFVFPLLGGAYGRWSAKWPRVVVWATRVSTGALAALYVLLVSHLLTGWARTLVPAFREFDPIVSDTADWTQLRVALQRAGMLDASRYFIVAGRWEICFKIKQAIGDALPIVCYTDNPIGAALATDRAALAGHDAIIVSHWWKAPTSLESVTAAFVSVEPMNPVSMTYFGQPARSVELEMGRTLRAPLPN